MSEFKLEEHCVIEIRSINMLAKHGKPNTNRNCTKFWPTERRVLLSLSSREIFFNARPQTVTKY